MWEKLLFSLAYVTSTNMEEVGFMTYTAVSHQEVIEILWLHFQGAILSSIFIYSLVGMNTKAPPLFTCVSTDMKLSG